MIIRVTSRDPSTLHAHRPGPAGEVTVLEPAELSRLHVELAGLEPADATQILASSNRGHLEDDDTAWISVEWLRQVVTDVPATWAEDFTRTVSQARSRGWLSSDGSQLKAHVVRHPDVFGAASSSGVLIDPPTRGAL